MKLKYRKAVFVVVYRKEKEKILYLLLKRKLHWTGWEFPKGGVRKKEIKKEAVLREAKEETGQKAEKIKTYSLSGKYKYDKLYKDRAGIIGQTWRLYSCEIENKKIKIDKKEHSRHKWLPYEKALKKLTWANQKKCLKIVNRKIKNKEK